MNNNWKSAHHIEGDFENENYWYIYAKRPPFQNPLKDEVKKNICFITQIY